MKKMFLKTYPPRSKIHEINPLITPHPQKYERHEKIMKCPKRALNQSELIDGGTKSPATMGKRISKDTKMGKERQ
jgi:hypothetical protein